jgi:hypothetical protein
MGRPQKFISTYCSSRLKVPGGLWQSFSGEKESLVEWLPALLSKLLPFFVAEHARNKSVFANEGMSFITDLTITLIKSFATSTQVGTVVVCHYYSTDFMSRRIP